MLNSRRLQQIGFRHSSDTVPGKGLISAVLRDTIRFHADDIRKPPGLPCIHVFGRTWPVRPQGKETAESFGGNLAHYRAHQEGSDLMPEATAQPPFSSEKAAVPVYVLYMDIVDSTRATIDHQDRVNAQLRDLVAGSPSFQSALAAGEVISLPTGDGMALVFFNRWDSPIRCATEITRKLRANPFCHLRMGIHCGPVIVENDINGRPNVSGDGISLAARIMSCGGSGHILLTRNAADLYRNLAPWNQKLFRLGQSQVKKDVVDIWNYFDDSVGSESPVELKSPTGKAEQDPSIAVLPFENMSADKEQEYFSDGLAEEIINLLARMPGLKVISRKSAFAFRGGEQDVRRIGQELGVRTIHEGSVRRAGQRIRVTAQLVSTEDGSHLFADRYDRELTDVFAVQDEIAGAIASALQVRLKGPSEPRNYVPAIPAYEAYLKGRHHASQANPDALELSRKYYELAIGLDPGFALPHSALAHYYFLLTNFSGRPAREVAPLAKAEAAEALRIDPNFSEAHAMMGTFAAMFDLKHADTPFGVVEVELAEAGNVNRVAPLQRLFDEEEEGVKYLFSFCFCCLGTGGGHLDSAQFVYFQVCFVWLVRCDLWVNYGKSGEGVKGGYPQRPVLHLLHHEVWPQVPGYLQNSFNAKADLQVG